MERPVQGPRADTHFGIAYALVAFLIAAAFPIKEGAFVLALLLIFLARPLNGEQIRLVLVQIWPVLVMLALGLIMTLVDVTGEFEQRALIRIVFYYIRIPTFLLLGFAARRYIADDKTMLWAIIVLGVWNAGQSLFRYKAGGDLSGLSHNNLREVIGTGDTISIFIPICALTLWPRTRVGVLRVALLGASALAVLAVLAVNSRTGMVVLLLSALLTLPRTRPLLLARWGGLAILAISLIVTTPILPPILHLFGIDPPLTGGLAEVIARPRTDFKSINDQWRGYETYMAFAAASRDGILPLLFGHGMSVYAPLGVLIELAPDQLFDRIDIFHNGWAFIVMHSGLLGILLYTGQFLILTRAPAVSSGRHLRPDNRLFALVILSLAAGTAAVAGAFNAGTFASVQLFLLGFFYPFSLVPHRQATMQSISRPAFGGGVSWHNR